MALTPLPTDLRGIELRTADRPSPLPTHFKHFNSALRARRSVPEACASARVTFRSRTDTSGKKERRREKEREIVLISGPRCVAQVGGRKRKISEAVPREEEKGFRGVGECILRLS